MYALDRARAGYLRHAARALYGENYPFLHSDGHDTAPDWDRDRDHFRARMRGYADLLRANDL